MSNLVRACPRRLAKRPPGTAYYSASRVLINYHVCVPAALEVDEELHADKVTKILSAEGCQLKAEFAACDARMLRVSVNSFFDMVALATQTLDAF